jgi:hypothetical protein
VSLAESNARFTFNFRDVYWNSRLQMEHHRLVDIIRRTAARRRRRKAQPHGGLYVCFFSLFLACMGTWVPCQTWHAAILPAGASAKSVPEVAGNPN